MKKCWAAPIGSAHREAGVWRDSEPTVGPGLPLVVRGGAGEVGDDLVALDHGHVGFDEGLRRGHRRRWGVGRGGRGGVVGGALDDPLAPRSLAPAEAARAVGSEVLPQPRLSEVAIPPPEVGGGRGRARPRHGRDSRGPATCNPSRGGRRRRRRRRPPRRRWDELLLVQWWCHGGLFSVSVSSGARELCRRRCRRRSSGVERFLGRDPCASVDSVPHCSRIFVTCDFYAGCSRRDFLFRTAKSIKTVTAFQTLVETDTDEHQLERRHRPSVRYCAGLETVTTAAGARTAGAAARDGRGLWTRVSHPWSLSFPLRLSPSLSSRTARDHREASSPTLFPTPQSQQTDGGTAEIGRR